MNRSRFSEQQIIGTQREQEAGAAELLAEAMRYDAMLKDIASKNGDAHCQTRGRGSLPPPL